MESDYYDNAQMLAGDIASRTEGIAFLLYNFNPEGHGKRDIEAMKGVAMILEDISKMAHKLDGMLDSVARPKK